MAFFLKKMPSIQTASKEGEKKKENQREIRKVRREYQERIAYIKRYKGRELECPNWQTQENKGLIVNNTSLPLD